MEKTNPVINEILTRRSIKKFKPDMVPNEDLETIIQAGLHAASGMNRQAPIIIAVTDKEVRDKLAKINARIRAVDTDTFYGAPVVLVVLSNKEVPTYLYDGSLALGNMMLAADSMGYGCCWIHRAKETFELPEWKEFLKSLGIEGVYEGIGNLIVGYSAMEKPDPRGEIKGRSYFV